MAIPKNMKAIYCTPIYPRGGTIDLLITDDPKKGGGDVSSLFSVSSIIVDISGYRKYVLNFKKGVLHDETGQISETTDG